jgi:RNA polymerase sigma-70 factor (ECF subfamily)
MPETDERLVQQAQRDPQAFGPLYDRYVDRIYGFAFRQTGDEALAGDVTSATFEKALRNLRRFRWQGISFCAWLYRIARNEITQTYRRQRLFTPLLTWQVSEINVELTVQANEQRDALEVAFSNLSEDDQDVLALRFFEDLPSAEVAEILGCSVQNVYMRLHRALGRLRKRLENEMKEGEQAYVSR